MTKRYFCPLIDRECVGIDCMFAACIDSWNVSVTTIKWVCALTNSAELAKHGTFHAIAEEWRKND